ncbi:MAG: AMP-binding protein, partial [Acidobacteria bacterium]|nr:AMP-binding protein [Acidobacteriota bacterium]
VALPLFHIAALGHLLSVFHAGGANVITAKYDAAQAVELIDRHAITMISDFPPVLTTLLDAAAEAGSRLPSLRHVTGLDSPDTMQRLHDETDATFWAGFGQCETSGFVTIQNARERLGCAGKAAELCSVRLVDDDDREVPAGEDGEIVVRGPLVFLGYDGQPDVTAHTFRGGWHHTGDIGRFDEEGNLFYVARKPEKELMKPGGENVYPAEVEAAILEIDAVHSACVFGVSDDRWGEAIRAVVEADPEAGLDQEAVREHVGSRIARFKRPRDVIFTGKLP